MDTIGYQKNIDCYECEYDLINNSSIIKNCIMEICTAIEAEIVTYNNHIFDRQGISAYAIITTSHIAIHTWPEYGYAAVDIFSCKGEIQDDITKIIKRFFSAQRIKVKNFTRGNDYKKC